MKRFASLLLCLLFSTHAPAAPKEGEPAPRFTLKTLDGARIDNASTRGQVTVLTFWATWCAYCRQELADLAAYYRQHAQDGLKVVAISMDDADVAAAVRSRAKEYPFPVAFAADADVTRYGRVWRLPLTFVVDRRGILRRDGWTADAAVSRAQMDETLTPLLREKP